MKILIAFNNPSLIDWLKKRLIDHDVVPGSLEEVKSSDMVVCGPDAGCNMDEYIGRVESLLKDTGGKVPVIFVPNEDSDNVKARLSSTGLPEKWVVSPPSGQTVRASDLLRAIRRAMEEADDSDPPVFTGGSACVDSGDNLTGSTKNTSHVICVCSAKRGSGCNTVAASLVAHAAEAGLKTAAIDLGEPPCAGFHLGVPEPAGVVEPAVYETNWGTLVVPGDDFKTIFEDVVSGHDVTVVISPDRLMHVEGAREVVVLDRDIQALEITSARLAVSESRPVIFVNRSSESSRPDAACIFEQKGYEVITAGKDTAGCVRALADGKPALTRSVPMAQAVGRLVAALKLLG